MRGARNRGSYGRVGGVRLSLPLVALIAVLAIPVPAGAALPAGNVVQNGDAEGGPGATNSTDVFPPPAWDNLPTLPAVAYGSPAFPGTDISSVIGGGRNLFAGGPENGFGDFTASTQNVDLSAF